MYTAEFLAKLRKFWSWLRTLIVLCELTYLHIPVQTVARGRLVDNFRDYIAFHSFDDGYKNLLNIMISAF